MEPKKPSILLSIFKRKGEEGIKTRIIHEGNKSIYPLQLSFLLAAEQPLVCFREDDANWVLVTGDRVIASGKGEIVSLPYGELVTVNMALAEEYKDRVMMKTDFTRLVLKARNGESHLITLEKGKPYWGIFQLLHFAVGA
ncbi:MAG: hypothetical protein J7623_08500 [Chitinophaga sp.]|uniref:hypothetical protein n=1 Tax=Chitinophaga sp. TaxID=1869181 RepID=UPI001B0BFE3D|nr:hypothetical protein [Chitinophaga sp.]MBO9728662.1 hypothetical protein [Chitinophaga sp.]